MLIFAPGRRFPYQHLQDLQGRSIATVRGYGYAGSEYFQRNDGADARVLIYLMTPVFWIAWSGAISSMRMRSCRRHVGR